MRAKFVNESIKHLKGRTEKKIYEAWKKRIEEINQMEPYDLITAVYEEVRDYEVIPRDQYGNLSRPIISWKKIAAELLGRIDPVQREEAIINIMNNYLFG